jgi:Rap1a immunity proteins
MCTMRLAPLLVTGMLLLASVSDDARAFDGNEVYAWCQHPNGVMAAGYVAGLIDQSRLSAARLKANHYTPPTDQAEVHMNVGMMFSLVLIGEYCIPPEARLGQGKDVFCSYLRNTPQDRHLPAAYLFQQAMQGAWPCK